MAAPGSSVVSVARPAVWALQVLWISHCGLQGLDGLNALPSLRELYAAFNQIDNLEPVAGKPTFPLQRTLALGARNIPFCTLHTPGQFDQLLGNLQRPQLVCVLLSQRCITLDQHLSTLPPGADMERLEVLDLEGNRVDDLGALVYLGWCPQLAVLTLADNPVAQEPTYTAQVPSCDYTHSNASVKKLYRSAYRSRPKVTSYRSAYKSRPKVTSS